MRRIEVSRAARKSIEALPPKHARQVATKIVDLGRDPTPHDSKPLRGKLKPFLRVDVGEYRIIYRLEGDEVLIAAVGRRNDDAIYREFGRSKLR